MQLNRLERLFFVSSSLNTYILLIFPVFSDVAISDISVAIYVSGPHRRDVLDAVSFLIEQLKTNVPIWKKVTFFFFIHSLSSAPYIHMNNSIILCRSSTKIMRTTTITHQHLIAGKKINKFFFSSFFFVVLFYINTYTNKDKHSKQYECAYFGMVQDEQRRKCLVQIDTSKLQQTTKQQ